jgi:hypothetical protein
MPSLPAWQEETRMNKTSITRRGALRIFGASIVTMTAAAVLPAVPTLAVSPTAPADPLVGWEPTLTGPAHRAAVIDVADALTERLMVASERSAATRASFERLALDGYVEERGHVVADRGAEAAAAIFGDALRLQLHLLRQAPTA